MKVVKFQRKSIYFLIHFNTLIGKLFCYNALGDDVSSD